MPCRPAPEVMSAGVGSCEGEATRRDGRRRKGERTEIDAAFPAAAHWMAACQGCACASRWTISSAGSPSTRGPGAHAGAQVRGDWIELLGAPCPIDPGGCHCGAVRTLSVEHPSCCAAPPRLGVPGRLLPTLITIPNG